MKVDTAALRDLMTPGSTCHLVSAEELRTLVRAYDALDVMVGQLDFWRDYPRSRAAALRALNGEPIRDEVAEFTDLAESSPEAVATLTAAMVPRDPQKVQEAADTARILMIQDSRRIAKP